MSDWRLSIPGARAWGHEKAAPAASRPTAPFHSCVRCSFLHSEELQPPLTAVAPFEKDFS